MQQNLAKSVDGSNTALQADQPGNEPTARHRGMKRDAAPESQAGQIRHSAKRSRLAVSVADDIKHDNSQQSLDHMQPAEGQQEDEAFESVMQMVQQVQANRVSRLARDAKDCLRNLDAAEGIGVIAWLVDGMLTQRTDEKSKDVIQDWVADLGSFIRRRTQ